MPPCSACGRRSTTERRTRPAAEAEGGDKALVGRRPSRYIRALAGCVPAVAGLRRDCALDNGLAFWVSGDQLLRGAALNAVEIAELL